MTRLLPIVLCLMLGAISSPLLAWLCALSPTSWDSTIRWVRDDSQMLAWIESQPEPQPSASPASSQTLEDLVNRAMRAQEADADDRDDIDLGYYTVVHGFGLRHHYFSSLLLPLSGHGRLRTGWPFAAFETMTPLEPSRLKGFFGSPDPKFDDTSRTIRIGEFQRAIPIRPLWTGLFGNALVLAIVWWIGIAIYRQVRGVLRRYRGRCPDCNYDLRANLDDGCPECGWRRATSP